MDIKDTAYLNKKINSSEGLWLEDCGRPVHIFMQDRHLTVFRNEGTDVNKNQIYSLGRYRTDQIIITVIDDMPEVRINGLPFHFYHSSDDLPASGQVPDHDFAPPELIEMISEIKNTGSKAFPDPVPAAIKQTPAICMYCAYLRRPHRGICTKQNEACSRRLQSASLGKE